MGRTYPASTSGFVKGHLWTTQGLCFAMFPLDAHQEMQINIKPFIGSLLFFTFQLRKVALITLVRRHAPSVNPIPDAGKTVACWG
ncbi:MAG: hypothetical protein Q7T05_04850 [Dehalococcoidia bacterium]|nr:hypothetical protein [Dehalococcoidia bacterium]